MWRVTQELDVEEKLGYDDTVLIAELPDYCTTADQKGKRVPINSLPFLYLENKIIFIKYPHWKVGKITGIPMHCYNLGKIAESQVHF